MKRFYKDVSIANAGDGWQVMLDGRGVKSQGGSPQVVPTRALAELLAGEWRDQGEEIDPRSFVYRDMADYAIDVIEGGKAEAVANLIRFSETDTLCYRADPGTPLFEKQEQLWEPVVKQCEGRRGVTFARVSGVVPHPQKGETIAALTDFLEGHDGFQLAGMQTMTALAASLIIGLAALEDGADAESLFDAANCEEDWQADLWGWDELAAKARIMRVQAFTMAHDFLKAARS